MSSAGTRKKLTLQERIQQSRRRQRTGGSSSSQGSSPPSKAAKELSPHQVRVKDSLNRAMGASSPPSTASSSPSSPPSSPKASGGSNNKPLSPKSPKRHGESFAQRRERVFKVRPALQQSASHESSEEAPKKPKAQEDYTADEKKDHQKSEEKVGELTLDDSPLGEMLAKEDWSALVEAANRVGDDDDSDDDSDDSSDESTVELAKKTSGNKRGWLGGGWGSSSPKKEPEKEEPEQKEGLSPWPPSLKTFLDDHEQQQVSSRSDAKEAPIQESQPEAKPEPVSAKSAPIQEPQPEPASVKSEHTQKSETEKKPQSKSEGKPESITVESAPRSQPALKPSWVRQEKNDEPKVESKAEPKQESIPAEQRAPWLRTSPAVSTSSVSPNKPSWVKKSTKGKTVKPVSGEQKTEPAAVNEKEAPWMKSAGKERALSPAMNSADGQPSINEQTPPPTARTVGTKKEQAPWWARTEAEAERAPSPVLESASRERIASPKLVDEMNKEKAPWARDEQTPSPASNSATQPNQQRAPWARHVLSAGTVTAMSPESSEGKDAPWAQGSKKEAPPRWPAEVSASSAERKAASEASSMSNGSKPRSFRLPPQSPQVGSAGKFVPPWVRKAEEQPKQEVPTKNESKWSRKTAPSPPEATKSPTWTRSADNKETVDSPPSPSRIILSEVKARRKPVKQELKVPVVEERRAEEALVEEWRLEEPAQDSDEAKVVVSYGGAVIETPKAVSVASMRSAFGAGEQRSRRSGDQGSRRRSRSSPPPSSRRAGWIQDDSNEGERQPEPAEFPERRYGTKDISAQRNQPSSQPSWKKQGASGGSSAVQSTKPSWAKQESNDGGRNEQDTGPVRSPQPSWVKQHSASEASSTDESPQPSWMKQAASSGGAKPVPSSQPSWKKPSKSFWEQPGSSQSSQPSWAKLGAARRQANDVKTPDRVKSWLKRAASQPEMSSIPSSSSAQAAPSQGRSAPSWVKQDALEEDAPPSWVQQDISQGEISDLYSPPVSSKKVDWPQGKPISAQTPPPSWIKKDASQGELSPIQTPEVLRRGPRNKDQTLSPDESWEDGMIATDSADQSGRSSEGDSQRPSPFPAEEPNSSVMNENEIVEDGSQSAEQAMNLSQTAQSVEGNTVRSDPSPLSSPTKSLAQLASESVFAIDYDLMMAQAQNADTTEDEDESLVSSGIRKATPSNGELPDDMQARMEKSMDKSKGGSQQFDDSRAYEGDYFSTERSNGSGAGNSGSWNSKDVSAPSQSSSVIPRLSPSKRDTELSMSPRKLSRRALNFSDQETPTVLEESENTSSRILDKIRTMTLEEDEDYADDGAVDPVTNSVTLGNESTIDLGNPQDFTILQISPVQTPQQTSMLGTSPALFPESPEDMEDGHSGVRFGDPKSFGSAGGEVVEEPAPSVVDRSHAIEEWEGGKHWKSPRTSRPAAVPHSPPHNARGAKHVLEYYSAHKEEDELKVEASQMQDSEDWAMRDPGFGGLRMSPPPENEDPRISEDMDALKDWREHSPPADAKSSNAPDPFSVDVGDPFATSNIASGEFSLDPASKNVFNPFMEDESFDFQQDASTEYFSPYGDEPKEKTAKTRQPPPVKTRQPAVKTRQPVKPALKPAKPTRQTAKPAGQPRLAPSRRDRRRRQASAARYDAYYAQQAISNDDSMKDSRLEI